MKRRDPKGRHVPSSVPPTVPCDRWRTVQCERGRTVNAAVETLRAEKRIPDVWQQSGKTVTADLAVFGGDVHLREVVER